MSYILDALKKSEQERGKGNIPNVQTIHSASLKYDNKKNTYWPYILIAIVLLNLIAISYFIFNKEKNIITSDQNTTNSTLTASITEETPEPIDVQKKERKKELASRKNLDSKPEKNITANRKSNKTLPKKVEAGTNNYTTSDYYELPDSIKNRLPLIHVSAHVFSKNPLQRSIVINDNFMEEGEYLSKKLMLHEITRDGAIFNFEGRLITYNVVSKWQ